jgi:hypothetical protein
VQHLTNHRDWRQPGKSGEIDRRFGVAATLEHATTACPQREHVSGAHEVVATRAGIEHAPDRRGAVSGADPAPGGVMVDRHRERGVARGPVGRHHGADLELVEPVRVARHAHEATRPPQHEVDRVGRDPLGGHREVTLVLAVFVVHDEHHLASADAAQGFVDRGQGHGRSFLGSIWAGTLTRRRGRSRGASGAPVLRGADGSG